MTKEYQSFHLIKVCYQDALFKLAIKRCDDGNDVVRGRLAAARKPVSGPCAVDGEWFECL